MPSFSRTPPVWMCATALLAVLALALSVSMGQDNAGAPAPALIKGKITSGPKKWAVAGATVLVYHLATATIYRSTPTDAKGRYEVSDLAHGYYDVAIESPDGLYVGNQVVNLVPGGKVVSNFNLQAGGAGQAGPRDFPGSDQPATGIASFLQKDFWMKPKGIAVWAGGSAVAAALLLSGSSSSSGAVSQSLP